MTNIFVIFYERYITAGISQKEPNPCVNSLTQGLYKRKEAVKECADTALVSISTHAGPSNLNDSSPV